MSKPLKPWFYFYTTPPPAAGDYWIKQFQHTTPLRAQWQSAAQIWDIKVTSADPDFPEFEFGYDPSIFPWWRAL